MGKKNYLKTEIRNVLISRTRSSRCSCRCCSSCDKIKCPTPVKTVGFILMFYTFSISLTFFNQKFIHHFRFPLSITMTHLITKFVVAAIIRGVLYCKTGKHRVTLSWTEYLKRVAPPGITGSLDIGLSNWSFAFITISLYTMTKTTAIVFIFAFSVLFRLEKLRWSLLFVVLFIAVGLFMFTYESTQFSMVGFVLVLSASFLSGMRWTLAQMVLQREETGLSNPLDMMYHIQPWMILSLLPLSTAFEGIYVATSEHAFGFQDGYLLSRNLLLLSFGAVLAFMLELSEFLVVSHASGLTLSVAGIFKEVITLLLAAFINGDEMSLVNGVGLVVCLMGITLHVVLKATRTEKDLKPARTMYVGDEQTLLSSHDDLDGPTDSSDELYAAGSVINHRR